MTDNTIEFHTPVRLGDVLRTHQVLRSVSEEKTTKLGTGRFWVIDVVYANQDGDLVAVESYTGFGYRRAGGGMTVADCRPQLLLDDVERRRGAARARLRSQATTVVLGALATRDWRPMHHDKDFAVERNGTQDIFLNTPNQAAWFERYLTDWTGPHGRLARVTFRMKGSVFPGDTMSLPGVVESTEVDDVGLRLRHRGRHACPWTATSRRRAPPASPCPARPTTTPGPDRASSGAPRRFAHERRVPVPCDHCEGGAECWILNSTRSRNCCARRCATCWPALLARGRAGHGGRPRRVSRHPVDPARRARSDRPAAARGVRRLGHVPH